MTCSVIGCANPVHIKKRQLCKSHYTRAWQAGEFGHTREGERWHRISDADLDAMTGDCSYCGPAARVVVRQGRPTCRASNSASKRRWRHGLSQEDVLALVESAEWKCEICNDSLRDQPYCIDHDHDCCPGKMSCGACVRGILCRRCNVGIGMLLDDPVIVAAALSYLAGAEKLQSTQGPSAERENLHLTLERPEKTASYDQVG